MSTKESKQHRPMNVYVRRGSKAEKAFRKRIGSPIPKVIVPGIAPSPEHDLKYQGGKTIQNLRFMNFYVGGDAWDPSDIANVDQALAAAMSDGNLNNVMVQYFPGPITTNFDGSQTLPGSAPQVISQGDVEQIVTTFYNGGKFTAHDLTSTVFNVILPPGTVLNTDTTLTGGAQHASAAVKKPAVKRKVIVVQDDADSLNGLGGYHGSVHASGTDTVYYAVGVYSQTEADGTVNGIPVFDQPWKNIVATFYHELNEARTDADVEDAIRARRKFDRGISGSGTNGQQRYRSRSVYVFGCGARTRRADCPSESTGYSLSSFSLSTAIFTVTLMPLEMSPLIG